MQKKKNMNGRVPTDRNASKNRFRRAQNQICARTSLGGGEFVLHEGDVRRDDQLTHDCKITLPTLLIDRVMKKLYFDSNSIFVVMFLIIID